MSTGQIVYVALLAVLWLARANKFVMIVLTCNLFATLAVLYLMDIGMLSRGDTTRGLMAIDLWSGAALVFHPGLARIVALGYVVTIPLYFANLHFGLPVSTTFAIVILIALAQLVVVGIGRGFGGGSRGRGHGVGRFTFLRSVVSQGGDCGVVAKVATKGGVDGR